MSNIEMRRLIVVQPSVDADASESVGEHDIFAILKRARIKGWIGTVRIDVFTVGSKDHQAIVKKIICCDHSWR